MSPWIFACPASRGIGFELTRRLLQTTRLPIVATARSGPEATKKSLLAGLEDVDPWRLRVLQLDVTEENTIARAAETCASLFPGRNLHLALAIPGILTPERSPAQISASDALAIFQVNTLGPLLLMKHFSPFLPRKQTALPSASELQGLPPRATWVNMSARVGSIGDNTLGGWYSYRASKAAVNQLTKTFDVHLRNVAGNKAVAVAMHPGTVRTDFSKEFWGNVKKEKLFEPAWAAESLLKVINGLGVDARGKCWDWQGTEVPP